jgi:hypothetical protein
MAPPTGYASFLIRLWHEQNLGQPGTAVDCCSEVEHIQSGQRWGFGSLDEMLDFLRQQVGGLEVSKQELDEQPKTNHERGGV